MQINIKKLLNWTETLIDQHEASKAKPELARVGAWCYGLFTSRSLYISVNNT